MTLERYEYRIGSFYHQYAFYSEGPRGRIKKTVLYTFLSTLDGSDYYNLGFGDLDEKEERINDLSISNNRDRDKILATVAITAIEFTAQFPGCKILVEGSTPVRTRLYQMSISKYYDEIIEIFDIQGLTEAHRWVPFKKGENYLAFLAARK